MTKEAAHKDCSQEMKTHIIKWSSISVEKVSESPARPVALKFINLTTPEESQTKQNRFKVRSHVVRERRRTHADIVRTVMWSNETRGILSRETLDKLYQKSISSIGGENSPAQSSICHESTIDQWQPKRSSSERTHLIPYLRNKSNDPCTLLSANSVDHFSLYSIEKRPIITENLGHYFAAIAAASIEVRQLPSSMFKGICTELAAFTLSSLACYHITLCGMLEMTISTLSTSSQSDMQMTCQHHRAVAVTELRKVVEIQETGNRETTLFVVISLAFDAFANGKDQTGRVHLEGFKTILRTYEEACKIRENSLLQRLVSDFVQKDSQAACHKFQLCNETIRRLMSSS